MFTSIHNRSFKLSLATLLSAFSLAAGTTGCANEEILTPKADVIDATKQPLEIGDLLSFNGDYGDDCTNRSGSWSLAVEGGATLANDPLSVIKDDSECVLTLTEIVADQTYTAAPSIDLDDSYAGSASAFAQGASPKAFYANAKIDPSDFSTAFTLTILYSDDLAAASPSNTAAFASFALGDQVTAPNYVFTDHLLLGIDDDDLVQSSAGTADFAAGSNTADKYWLDLGTLPASPTFAQVDTLYNSIVPISFSAPLSIDAADFELEGETLPKVRTVIFHHAESGVASYQVFKITFNAP